MMVVLGMWWWGGSIQFVTVVSQRSMAYYNIVHYTTGLNLCNTSQQLRAY